MAALSAGVGEEVLVLAVPVFVLKSARVPFAAALPLLVAMRVAFHLYYGYSVLWLLPWAIGVTALYWRWPSPKVLCALIIAHTGYDIPSMLGANLQTVTVVAAVMVVVAVGCGRWWREPPLPVAPARKDVPDGTITAASSDPGCTVAPDDSNQTARPVTGNG